MGLLERRTCCLLYVGVPCPFLRLFAARGRWQTMIGGAFFEFARRIGLAGAYSRRTREDEGEQEGSEIAGQGGEVHFRRVSDPDFCFFAGLDRTSGGGDWPARAAFVCGADRACGGARRGGAGYRALVSGAGALALCAEGACHLVDRARVARFDLPGNYLPGAAPDRAAHHAC